MRAAKVQASLRIRAVSPAPPLLAHTSSESRGTVRQKARSLAPLNVWACAVKICHDGMLEDTDSFDAAQLVITNNNNNNDDNNYSANKDRNWWFVFDKICRQICRNYAYTFSPNLIKNPFPVLSSMAIVVTQGMTKQGKDDFIYNLATKLLKTNYAFYRYYIAFKK